MARAFCPPPLDVQQVLERRFVVHQPRKPADGNAVEQANPFLVVRGRAHGRTQLLLRPLRWLPSHTWNGVPQARDCAWRIHYVHKVLHWVTAPPTGPSLTTRP